MLNLCLAIVWLFLIGLRTTLFALMHDKPTTGKYNVFAAIVWLAIPVYLIVNAYILGK